MDEPTSTDHQEKAREAEEAAEELKHHGDQLGESIQETRQDWEHKQDDQSVPGAVPDPEDREGQGAPGAEQSDAEDEES